MTARATRIGFRTASTAPIAAGREAGAIHDHRVELDAAVPVEDAATAGIEGAVVLHDDDGRLHRGPPPSRRVRARPTRHPARRECPRDSDRASRRGCRPRRRGRQDGVDFRFAFDPAYAGTVAATALSPGFRSGRWHHGRRLEEADLAIPDDDPAEGKTATGIGCRMTSWRRSGRASARRSRVTINGFTYRSSMAVMGGTYMIGVSAENRAGAGVLAATWWKSSSSSTRLPARWWCRRISPPRSTPSRRPDHLRRAVVQQQVLARAGDQGAKAEETRRRRIAKSVEALRDGRPR